MAHDYKAEIAAALKSDDAATLAGIAYILLGRVQESEAQREKENERKRNWRKGRDTTGHDVAGRHATDATSHDGMRRDATSPSVSVVDPVQTPEELKADNTPAREAVAAVDDVKLQVQLDAMRLMCGDQWPDIEAFLMRREYVKWSGWLDEMQRLVKIGSQFTPDDLARVCRDDRVLRDPLGSCFALRRFLGNARQERLAESRSPPSAAVANGARGDRPGIGQRAFDTTRAAIEDL